MTSTEEPSFALRLEKIILGPNFPNIETNHPLLIKKCKKVFGIEVERSALTTYR